jgi:Zn-dependent protease with chaperone function
VHVWRIFENRAKAIRLGLFAIVFTAPACVAFSQPCPSPEKVPANFADDAAFATEVRSVLIPQSQPAGPDSAGVTVLQNLVHQLSDDTPLFGWELRIARDAGNMFASPDGTIYVDQSLAQFLGTRSGLWAAALSHEIAHVVRRDWARRFLLQKALDNARGAQLVLGDTASAGSWVDSRESSAWQASCSQTMELEADAQSLFLMARAGFHPDFVPALHHALAAQPLQWKGQLADASHPTWDERDGKLTKLLIAAGKEFDRLWPERDASPGGNPPIVVYTGAPSVRRHHEQDAELMIPLNCQNLAGSVEVVLRWKELADAAGHVERQFTGCTSKRTLVTFTLPTSAVSGRHVQAEGDVSILDDRGVLLTRSVARIPKR